VGRDRWDGIIFIPNRPIKVIGMGIFEAHPNGGSFSIGYKYIIQDSSGTDIFTSAIYEEQITGANAEEHIIWYEFQQSDAI